MSTLFPPTMFLPTEQRPALFFCDRNRITSPRRCGWSDERSELLSEDHGADCSSIFEFLADGDLQPIGPLLARTFPDVVVSKRQMRKVESIECVRLKQETARQNLGFSSRLLYSAVCRSGVLPQAVCCTSAEAVTWFCSYRTPQVTVCRRDETACPDLPCDSGDPAGVASPTYRCSQPRERAGAPYSAGSTSSVNSNAWNTHGRESFERSSKAG
jgi:hypothetical protein